MSTSLASRAAVARVLVWLSLAALLLVQLADVLEEGIPLIIAGAKLLPLLLFVPGMMRDNLRSFIWLCFVCLLYFISLVTRSFADPESLRSALGLVSVVILFISAMLYVRWRARSLSPDLGGESPEQKTDNSGE